MAFTDGDFVIAGHRIDYIVILVAFVLTGSILAILSVLENYLQGLPSRSSKKIGKTVAWLMAYALSVLVFAVPVFYLCSQNFKLDSFCLMNRREHICVSKQQDLDCFNKGNELSLQHHAACPMLQHHIGRVGYSQGTGRVSRSTGKFPGGSG